MYTFLDVLCLVVLGGFAYVMAKRKNRDEVGWAIVAAVAFYLVGMAAEQLLAKRLGLVTEGAIKGLAYGAGIGAGIVVNIVLLLKPPLDLPIKGKDKGSGEGGEPPAGEGEAPAEPGQGEGEAPSGEDEAPAEPPQGEGEAPAEPPADKEMAAAEAPEPIPASELTPEALGRRFWPVLIPLALFVLAMVPALGRAVFGPVPDNPADDPRFFLLVPVIGVFFWRIRGRPLEGLLAGLFTLAYVPAIAWMQWRWGRGSSYYSHGYLIPLVVGWLIWLNRHRLAKLRVRDDMRFLGLAVLGVGLLVLLAGTFMRTYSVQGVSFVIVLGGAVCFLFGGAVARALWFPLAFVITMIPMPMHLVERITFKLKMFAAAGAVWVVDALRAIGIHSYLVVQDGSYIKWEASENLLARLPAMVAEKQAYVASLIADGLPPESGVVADVGKNIHEMERILASGMDEIIIGDVCSGLRSLIALLAFGALFAYLSKMSLPKRLLLFAAAVPISVLANMWRIVTLAFVACRFSSLSTHGFVHDVTGYGIFAVAFVLFFSFERLLRRIGPEDGDATELA